MLAIVKPMTPAQLTEAGGCVNQSGCRWRARRRIAALLRQNFGTANPSIPAFMSGRGHPISGKRPAAAHAFDRNTVDATCGRNSPHPRQEATSQPCPAFGGPGHASAANVYWPHAMLPETPASPSPAPSSPSPDLIERLDRWINNHSGDIQIVREAAAALKAAEAC
jgi:hypothetical protein